MANQPTRRMLAMHKYLRSIVASTCLFGLLLGNVGGSQPAEFWGKTCRKASECSTPDSYCLNGYCEPCVPCENFGRQQPFTAGRCAKNEEDCGPCITGHEAEDHTGMRHSFRCRKLEEVETKSDISFTWIIAAIAVFTLVTGVPLYIYRRKISAFQRPQLLGSSRPTSENITEVVQRDPPYNPNWREEYRTRQALASNMELNEERIIVHANNVQAEPFSVDSDVGEDPDGPSASLLSNAQRNLDENITYDVFTGPHEGEIIELSNFRNEMSDQPDNLGVLEEESRNNQTVRLSGLPSIILATSDDDVCSIDIDPGSPDNRARDFTGNRDEETASFGFFPYFKRVFARQTERE